MLGFASGLPLALTGLAMQTWLTMDGLDFAAIGFLMLIGIPYTFKFLQVLPFDTVVGIKRQDLTPAVLKWNRPAGRRRTPPSRGRLRHATSRDPCR